MKIVFMGTPDFAVGALEALVQAGHQVSAAVTQPDKPKGRGKEVQMPPVKQCALKYGIPVFQPVKIREPEAVETLRGYEADIFVVAAFGQILTEEILEMPKFGCICIHASLLPKYRGASPIQWAILNGEPESGVTIMQMAKGIDTGDMLMKCAVPVDRKETGESLHDKLCAAGAELIVRALPMIERGELKPEKQKEEDATYVAVIKKSLGHIDWSKDAVSIDRLVRGLNPWPSAYTYYQGKTLKIWECEPVDRQGNSLYEAAGGSADGQGNRPEAAGGSADGQGNRPEAAGGSADGQENSLYEAAGGNTGEESSGMAGSIRKVTKDAFYVQTGKGFLKVTQVQLEGKKRMGTRDFLLGYPLAEGTVLGKAD